MRDGNLDLTPARHGHDKGTAVRSRPSRLLTDDDLAAVIACSKTLVCAMRRVGTIPALRLGPRTWRYRSHELVTWLNSCRVAGVSAADLQFAELPSAGELVGAKFLAERLQVPLGSVYWWVHTKRVSYYRVSPRRPRFLFHRIFAELAASPEPPRPCGSKTPFPCASIDPECEAG